MATTLVAVSHRMLTVVRTLGVFCHVSRRALALASEERRQRELWQRCHRGQHRSLLVRHVHELRWGPCNQCRPNEIRVPFLSCFR